jgi:elongation factor Ts
MAAFTAKDVSELRQRTGAGMMECKKALEENQGDMEQAIEWLRKKGIAKAAKRAGNVASEGRIVSVGSPDGTRGVLVEVNSETDFVSRNEEFGALAQKIADSLLGSDTVDQVVPAAEGSAFAGTQEETLKSFSGKIGENIVLRRFARFKSDGAVGSYVHHNGKVAAMVEVTGGTGDAAQKLARTVAEHITAGVPSVPAGVNREDVPADVVEKERRFVAEQASASGKPENVVAKMVEGRMDKFYKEITLLDQPWVRDDSKTIRDLVKEAGAGLAIKRFARFQMGQE